ncbi:hypothetical protein DM01DRAFT_1271597, partial [Hesseltinella vesiculosa]
IALLIAVVFCLSSYLRNVVGDSVLLTAVVAIFYFPVRTYGKDKQHGISLLGTLGAFIAALWSLLGIYLSNLARDHSNPVPLQAGPSAILAIFLFIGSFFLNYLRMNFPK